MLHSIWSKQIKPIIIPDARVRLLSNAALTFENPVDDHPFEDPSLAILFRAEFVNFDSHDVVADRDRKEYRKFLGLPIVVVMPFVLKINPTSSVAMTFGVECRVDGTLKGVYEGTSDFASYFILEAGSIWRNVQETKKKLSRLIESEGGTVPEYSDVNKDFCLFRS